MPNSDLTYRRVLLKLSGEALSGDQDFGVEEATLDRVCREAEYIRLLGVE